MRLNLFENDNSLKNAGWKTENRPVEPGVIRTLYYKGEHTDSCIKTENGWICNDICPVEENVALNPSKIEVDELDKIVKGIDKIRLFKYKYIVKRGSIRRTFRDGRSYRKKDSEYVYETFLEGIKKTKYGAKKAMIDALDNSIPSYQI